MGKTSEKSQLNRVIAAMSAANDVSPSQWDTIVQAAVERRDAAVRRATMGMIDVAALLDSEAERVATLEQPNWLEGCTVVLNRIYVSHTQYDAIVQWRKERGV